MYVLLAVGALNTVVSAYYYLKVGRVMLLDEPEGAPVTAGAGAALFLAALVVLLFAAGVAWEPLMGETARAAAALGAVK